MKKIFTLAALAAICFASCSKNEVIVPETEGNAINFGTYTANAPVAKAADINATNLTQLYVSAYAPGTTPATSQPTFMKNEELNKNGAAWTYENTKYWPANTNAVLTFYAVAPRLSNLAWPAASNEVLCTVGSVASAQTDLLWDEVAKSHAQTIGENSVEDQVQFNMEHMLSRLGVEVKLAAEYKNATLTINSIQLGDATTGFATGYTFNLQTGKTSAYTGAAGYTWDKEGTNKLATNLALTTAAPGPINALAAANELILAPQGEIKDIPVEIAYTENGVDNIKKGKVTLNLQPGNQYKLLISIQMCAITFDVLYTGWDTAESNTITWVTEKAETVE